MEEVCPWRVPNPWTRRRETTPTCESLGIKPELRRTLGFLSNFALAFSYIWSRPARSRTQAVAFGVGGPAIFWAWPLVILGQTFVALNFAELASHFPVAGSIYQWSKRLSNRTLGWFTGWIYFWAGVITVTAVAATVPLVMSTIWPDQIKLADPSPIAGARHAVVHRPAGRWSRRRSSTSSASGCSRSSTTSASAPRSSGMLVFALILLFFANHQSPSVLLDTSYTSDLADGNYFAVVPRRHVHGPVRGLRLRHRRDVRRGDRRREPPGAARASCRRSGCRASSARSSCSAVTLSFQDMSAAVATGQAFGFPIADTIKQNLTFAIGGITLGDLYLVVILLAVYVCTLAIQGATTRLMFSMGRDRRLPLGRRLGPRQPHASRPRPTPPSRSASSRPSRSSSPAPARRSTSRSPRPG